MPSIKNRVVNAIQSAPSSALHKVKDNLQASKAKRQERETFREITAKRSEAEYRRGYAENYRSKSYEQGKAEAEGRDTGKGGLRRGASNVLASFSAGSSKALQNDMYGIGKVDMGQMDMFTIGGPAGADTLRNVEYITGVSERKKVIAPQGGQPGRGNIVINVGGSASNRKRKPAAQVPREKDWQDNLSDITGF
jgi:hypothetical protein